MKKLNESLEYLDMEGQITPVVGIDQFKSTVGSDKDIITLNFIVSSKDVATDLCGWFEKGYDWVIDAESSPGEVLGEKYYVFVELNRRSTAPRRIMEMLSDLDTLTGIKADEWRIHVENKKAPASIETIEECVALDPNTYMREQDDELNEMRQIAGIKTTSRYDLDEDMLNIQRQAGIK